MTTHIIHLADIHIRTGNVEKSRFEEYRQVIRTLGQTVSELECVREKTALILVLGDIFEHKNRIESSGLLIFHEFVKTLTDAAPTILIQGNHDFQQADIDAPDILTSLSFGNSNPNYRYLDRTGQTEISNVGFGLVDIKEVLRCGSASGSLEATELPPFPDPRLFSSNVQHKIALFHGPIQGASGVFMDGTGVSPKWFSGYDLILLGDIHTQQVDGQPLAALVPRTFGRGSWGYSGSLIQQNFGESPSDHGCLLWDLVEHTVQLVPIHNSFGMANLRRDKLNWYVLPQRQLLSDFLSKEDKKHLLVKIKGASDHETFSDLQEIFSQKSVTFRVIGGVLHDGPDPDAIDQEQEDIDKLLGAAFESVNISGIEQFNSFRFWIEYIQGAAAERQSLLSEMSAEWRLWLENPMSLLTKTSDVVSAVSDKLKERNHKLENEIVQYTTHNGEFCPEEAKLSFLNLDYVSWEWILPFGKGNWFNFHAIEGKICCIHGRNDAGKSSFLEIIVLGIFGKSIPSRDNQEPENIICKQKPADENAFIRLKFHLDDVAYEIFRPFNILKKTGKLDTKASTLSILHSSLSDKRGTKCEEVVIKCGNKVIEAWVNEHIGPMASFLLSGMLTQNDDIDFLLMDKKAQLSFLNQALKLDNINKMTDILRTSKNDAKFYHSQLEAIYNRLQETRRSDKASFSPLSLLEANEESLKEIQDRLQAVNRELQSVVVNDFSGLEATDLDAPREGSEKSLGSWEMELEKTGVLAITDIEDLKRDQTLKLEWQRKNFLRSNRKEQGREKGERDAEALREQLSKLDLDIKEIQANEPEKPQCDAGWLDAEKKEIDDILSPSRWPEEFFRGFDKEGAKREMTAAKEQLEKLSNEPVLRPNEKREDYTAFMVHFEREIAQYSSSFNSLDELRSYCEEHPSERPGRTKEQLEKERDGIQREMACVKRKQWTTLNVEDLRRLQGKIKEKLTSLDHEIRTIGDNLTTSSGELKILQEELSKKDQERNDLQKKKPQKPGKSKEWLAEWRSKYDDCIKKKSCFEAYLTPENRQRRVVEIQKKQLSKVVEQISQEIEENSKDLPPFNPDCFACKQQPWKLKLSKLEVAREKILGELKCLAGKDKGVEPFDEKMSDEALVWESEMQKLSSEHDQNSKMLSQWDDILTHQEQTDNVEREFAMLQNSEMILSRQVGEKKEKLLQLAKQKELVSSDTTDVDLCCVNALRWSETLADIVKTLRQWEEYGKNEHYHATLAKWECLETERISWEDTKLKKIREFEQWIAAKEEFYERKEKLSVLVEKFEDFEKHWNRRNKHLALAATHTAYVVWENKKTEAEHKQCAIQLCLLEEAICAAKKRDYWKRILEHEEKWKLYRKLTEEERNLRVSEELMRKSIKDRVDLETEMKMISSLMSRLSLKFSALEEIIALFGTYKQWLYQTKIIPRIISECNKMLRGINTNPTFNLGATVSQDTTMNWFVTLSSGVVVDILKAGGFRKFIFGLSLRIVLSYLGATKIKCRQLFIDEGFTSADATNIEKIPDFLNEILRYYASVVIVSHLGALTEMPTDAQVRITKATAGSPSSLSYGEQENPREHEKEAEKKKHATRKPRKQ